MQEKTTYNYKIVRQFSIMTVVWGIVGMLVGDLPTAFGLSPWISLVLGSAVIVTIVLWLGQRSEPSDELQA